jgi:hypothetical protein
VRAPRSAADVLPVRIGGMEYARTTSTPARVLGFDQALVWVVRALLAWGLVMVYSASIALPDNPRFGATRPPLRAAPRDVDGIGLSRADRLPGAAWTWERRRPGCSCLAGAADRGADSRTWARWSTARGAGSRWAP